MRVTEKYMTIKEASAVFRVSQEALVKRCERRVKKVGKDLIAELDDGYVAVKMCSRWRIRLSRKTDNA